MLAKVRHFIHSNARAEKIMRRVVATQAGLSVYRAYCRLRLRWKLLRQAAMLFSLVDRAKIAGPKPEGADQPNLISDGLDILTDAEQIEQLIENDNKLRKKPSFFMLSAGVEKVGKKPIRAQIDKVSAMATEHRRLLAEFRKVPVCRYGALQSGRSDWEARWDASKGRRILLYALSDYSGSFYKWAEAINRHTDFAARLVTYHTHQFGYDTDIVLPFPDVLKRSNMGELAAESDIIHLKDESGFYLNTNNLPPDLFDGFDKPKIYTAYGGYMRKLSGDEQFRQYVKGFDARISMTPDLNYDWFDGFFIPHAIDSDRFQYSWRDGRVLAHSPSTKERKGTDDLVAAVNGLDIEFDLISGVSHEECVSRKSSANLFFDQAGREIQERLGINTVIGWYGNSALEAAVFGIPTIAHLSEHAYDGAARAGRDIRDSCAILNTPLGSAGIRRTLEAYFLQGADGRAELSRRTRRWIEDFHSYQACAEELGKVYRGLL